MHFSLLVSALLTISSALPSIARAEQATLIDFNNHDKRSVGIVAWHMETLRAPDGHDDSAIRADIDIPDPKLKLKLVLHRNFDAAAQADYLIEFTFEVSPSILDGSISGILPLATAPGEMSGEIHVLLGQIHKLRSSQLFVQLLTGTSAEICRTLSALHDGEWLAVYLNGAKRKPDVFLPAVSDQSLWIERGPSGQQVIESVLAQWERTAGRHNQAGACLPS